jgi:hypothetical protein
MRGTCAFFRGEWDESLEHTREADAILAERCTNVAWERATNMRFELVSLYYLGRVGELSERVPGLVEIARDRDDLYARACAGSGCAIAAWLAADDLSSADENLRELEAHLANSEGFKLQHYMLLQGRTHTDLYRGRGREAWERIQGVWPAIERSLLLRVAMLRTIMLAERAACALAAGATDDAAESAKRLEAESLPWAAAMAMLARAGITQQRGDTAGAHALLERAAAELDAQGARLFAAAARLHRGDPGAERAFRDEHVKDPKAFAHSLVAGFRERP